MARDQLSTNDMTKLIKLENPYRWDMTHKLEMLQIVTFHQTKIPNTGVTHASSTTRPSRMSCTAK